MSAATWWSIKFNTPVQETRLAGAATTRETARGDQLLRTLRTQSESKWLQLKTWTFETPQTILQSSIKKCLSLCYQAYFMANLNLLHTWGGPPEQLLARQYHARPARAGATLEEAQNTSKTTQYLGQFSTRANLSSNNTVGSHSDSAEKIIQSTVNRKSNSEHIWTAFSERNNGGEDPMMLSLM